MRQHQRWVVLSFVVGAFLAGTLVQSALGSAFATFAIPDTRIGPITLSTLLALVTGGLTLLALVRSQKATVFSLEVAEELNKVTWPTREETVRAATTVVVTTLLVAALLGAYDFVWKSLADRVLLSS